MHGLPRSDEPSLYRRFFRLSLINILSNITVPIAGLVDTAMLGHLPDYSFLAGVALASVLFDYIYWTFGFLRMGTTGTTAQAVGRGDREEIFGILYRSLTLALGVALALLLLQLPLRELGFSLLRGEPAVVAAGRDYFDARIWGAPAALCNFAFVGWYLGREESRRALVMAIAANLSNIVFNYVFIIRLGWAARGAGLATMVSQYVMLAVALTIFFRGGRPTAWSWTTVLDRSRFTSLLRLNVDILVRTLFLVSSFAIFVNFSSMLGTATLAANSLLLRFLTLASYLIDGAAFAMESLAGIFLGRGDQESLQRLTRLGLLAGLGCAVVLLAGLLVAPELFFSALTSHRELVDLSVRFAPWLIPVLLFGSLAYMYDGLFLGLTEGRKLRNSMLLSTLVVFIPLALLALSRGSNQLLWASLAAFMAARASTLAYAARVRVDRFAG